MLEVRKLSRPGLHPVSFSLDAGRCLAVRGPSGSGKSLLLRAIADLDPSSGQVSWRGRERMDMGAPAWRRLVGYVPAEPGWWADNVAEHFLHWDESLARRLNLPDGVAALPVSRLSTGERQRLALLRALDRRPEVLLLDEPTAALDHATTLLVEDVLRERGLTLLWVTHDAAQAERVADGVLQVEAGRVAP